MIPPDATPTEGARFVRIGDLNDDYLVAFIDDDGTTVWRRVDPVTRSQLAGGVCEARYEPNRTALLSLPVDLVERIALSDDPEAILTGSDLATLRRAAAATWGVDL